MSDLKSSLSKEQGDLLMAAVLLAFTVLFYLLTYKFSGYSMEENTHDVGPAFMPRLMLAVMGLESLGLLIASWLKIARSSKPATPMPGVLQRRPVVMLAAFLAYIWLTALFGFMIATVAFMLLSLFLLGVRGLWTLLLVPPAMTAGTYFLFSKVLNIFLPVGSLF